MKETIKIDENKLPAKIQHEYKLKKLLRKREDIKEGVQSDFLNFVKENKISIHQFIFAHYKKQTQNNPSSMAIFDKKLRSIANTIKDEYIKKYVLEYFIEKISRLTPYTNLTRKNFDIKKTRSLDSTKKHYKESQSLSGVELKEFSLIYLTINNLDLMRDHIHLLQNIKLFTEVNKQIFEKIVFKLNLENNLTIDNLDIDTQLIDKITKFAPIKHILQKKRNKDHEVLELFEDIVRDLNNYDLEFRIQELESKFSKDLSETTFNELKELKKKQNIN